MNTCSLYGLPSNDIPILHCTYFCSERQKCEDIRQSVTLSGDIGGSEFPSSLSDTSVSSANVAIQPANGTVLIHTIVGREYIHISTMAYLLGRTTQSVRHLCLFGNKFRRLHHIREGSRIYVLRQEIWRYPFTLQGHQQLDAYHYEQVKEEDGIYRYKMTYCPECSVNEAGCCHNRGYILPVDDENRSPYVW